MVLWNEQNGQLVNEEKLTLITLISSVSRQTTVGAGACYSVTYLVLAKLAAGCITTVAIYSINATYAKHKQVFNEKKYALYN